LIAFEALEISAETRFEGSHCQHKTYNANPLPYKWYPLCGFHEFSDSPMLIGGEKLRETGGGEKQKQQNGNKTLPLIGGF